MLCQWSTLYIPFQVKTLYMEVPPKSIFHSRWLLSDPFRAGSISQLQRQLWPDPAVPHSHSGRGPFLLWALTPWTCYCQLQGWKRMARNSSGRKGLFFVCSWTCMRKRAMVVLGLNAILKSLHFKVWSFFFFLPAFSTSFIYLLCILLWWLRSRKLFQWYSITLKSYGYCGFCCRNCTRHIYAMDSWTFRFLCGTSVGKCSSFFWLDASVCQGDFPLSLLNFTGRFGMKILLLGSISLSLSSPEMPECYPAVV